MARDRKQLHLRRTGENRRVRRPTLREALREADRRARQRANQRSWRRRGLTAKQSAIAGTHYSHEELGWFARTLRILAGIALLPLCAIATVTLFDPQLHTGETTGNGLTFWQQFWRTNAFLYFTVGFFLNAGWFLTKLLQPGFLYLYVLGHELTHVIFVYLCLGRVSGFRVGLDGGHIVTNKSNILIALSPYFVLTALLAYAATRDVGVIINILTNNISNIFIVAYFFIITNYQPSSPIANLPTFSSQGAGEGILEFLTPKWEDFENYDVRKIGYKKFLLRTL